MSLCNQESFDAIALDERIEVLNQELLDAAASIDDSRPSLVPHGGPTETGLFMDIDEFDTIITPKLSFVPPARIRTNSRDTHSSRPVSERRDIYMSHKFADLLPFVSNKYPLLVTEHESRSYWNNATQPQVRTHVTPQEVEPPAGTYRTWKKPLVVPKPIQGMMEAVIDDGLHFPAPAPIYMPVLETTPPINPTPPPAQIVRSRVTTSRPVLVKQKTISYPLAERTAQATSSAAAPGAKVQLASATRSKATRKKTSPVSRTKSTLTGRFPCPSNCGHVCKSKGDLRRHLQSLAHQAPSFPCPNSCGNLFTREDAAERHGRSRGCPKL
ncbi:hypothetical protein BDZ94DRAFT_1238518 [Collybia nuda]|uniref:C2H2-type domain-containing protein n=1 Tax=Collybia nuda TaxID=64659 RepID=A0A9P6CC70_9AGAR|nr:hypothetical protein BDZ94DRAFT_1238518 [Collybia nuda]